MYDPCRTSACRPPQSSVKLSWAEKAEKLKDMGGREAEGDSVGFNTVRVSTGASIGWGRPEGEGERL